uniref:MYB transcription factor n=1 Tax=Ophiocordyceps sinensis TaxID=72228 RepID=A0A6G9W2T9_9HYPO|nr:MYB transcription factor [Ophiocordyceps sinensis]
MLNAHGHLMLHAAPGGMVKDWHQIAARLPGRSNKDCRKRWVNTVCGGLNKGSWSQDEDRRLLEALRTHGPKSVPSPHPLVKTLTWHAADGFWSPNESERAVRISAQNGGSMASTPSSSVLTVSFQDKLLLSLVQQYGRDWKRIQSHGSMCNRSKNDVKNRYTIMSRKLGSKGAIGAGETTVATGADQYVEDDGAPCVLDEADTPAAMSEPEQHVWSDDPRFAVPDDFLFPDGLGPADNTQHQFNDADFCGLEPGLFRQEDVDGPLHVSIFGGSLPGELTVSLDVQEPSSAGAGSNVALDPDPFSELQLHLGDGQDGNGHELGESHDTRAVAEMLAQGDANLPRVVIVIPECSRDTLDYVLDVMKPIEKSKVKVEVHM